MGQSISTESSVGSMVIVCPSVVRELDLLRETRPERFLSLLSSYDTKSSMSDSVWERWLTMIRHTHYRGLMDRHYQQLLQHKQNLTAQQFIVLRDVYGKQLHVMLTRQRAADLQKYAEDACEHARAAAQAHVKAQESLDKRFS